MADNTLNICPFFKFEIKTPARGLTDYDPGALHPDQQEQLNSYKLHLMRDNILYMMSHPEFKTILNWIAAYIWKVKPKDVVRSVAERFTLPMEELRRMTRGDVFEIEDDMVESEGDEWDY